MTEELAEKLKTDIDETCWNDLAPHEARQALILIDSSLDLADVGSKVASDDVESIKAWMDQGLVSRPTEEQLEGYKANPHSKQFHFLIIQPYVLAQLKQD